MARPLKFESPEQLLELGYKYFREAEAMVKIPTKIGLALALGTNRSTLHDYSDEEKHPGFSNAIKELYAYIEDAWVQASMNKEYATAGTIFYLKNAFNYRDKQDIDHTTAGQPIQIAVPQEIADKNALTPSTEGNSEG